MFKPGEYIDQLVKTNGAGLSVEDRRVFERMQDASATMDAIERKMQALRAELASLEQQRQQNQGRGAVLAELLYASYQENISAKPSTPDPAKQ